MNPYATPPLLAALLNASLVYWVYGQAPAGFVRRTFLLWNVWILWWNMEIAVGYLAPNCAAASAWYSWTVPVTISFLPVFFLHFTTALTRATDQLSRLMVRAGYFSGFVFTLTGTRTHFLIGPAHPFFWGCYPLAGWGAGLFGIAWMLLVGYAFWLLIRAVRVEQDHRRNQLWYVLLGASVGFGSGVTNFLPLFGVGFYPIGNLFNSVFSLLFAYAIVEYGLMDIRVVLKRGTVYGLLCGGLTAVYLSIVALLQRFFGHYGVEENVAFYMAAFPVTVILAPAMKARLEPFVDRAVFGETHPEIGPSSKVRQEMALMGVLATEMAHELAKPLTHIMNEGSRLETTIKGQAKESVTRIGKEVQRAAEILDGFALLSPDRPLHRLPTALSSLLEEAVASLGLEASSEIRILRQYDALPPIGVNPGQMVQVFSNVIQNAWQAMPASGVLTLALRSVLQEGQKPSVEIAVTDTGSGIPAEFKPKIFEPFFTTKQAQGGRGVGLTISRAMVERHGGTIQIDSPVAAGRGTRVAIRLPIV